MVRPVRLDAYSRPAARDYLEIPIKQDILEALEWLSEDEAVFLRLTPEIEEAAGNSFVVLELTLGEESERESYKLKSSDGYSVTLPATWEAHQEEYRGLQNPFYGLENDDQVVVVAFPDEKRIRVYHPEDYRKRTGLDIRAPSLAFLTNGLFNRFADIAGQTPYSGQKWEIVPFDAQHEVFEEEATGRNYRTFLGFRGNLGLFERVEEQDRLPVIRARKIRVRWNPFYEHPKNVMMDGPSMSKPKRKDVESGAFVVYRDYLTRCSRVILPEKGAFIVEAEVKDGSGWIAGGYFGGSIGWDAKYQTEEDDCFRMYVPTPTEFKEGREPENAKDWKTGTTGHQ